MHKTGLVIWYNISKSGYIEIEIGYKLGVTSSYRFKVKRLSILDYDGSWIGR